MVFSSGLGVRGAAGTTWRCRCSGFPCAQLIKPRTQPDPGRAPSLGAPSASHPTPPGTGLGRAWEPGWVSRSCCTGRWALASPFSLLLERLEPESPLFAHPGASRGWGAPGGAPTGGLQLHHPLPALGFLGETGAGTASPPPVQVPPNTSHPRRVLGTPEACGNPPAVRCAWPGAAPRPRRAHRRAPRLPRQRLRHPRSVGCLFHTCLPHTPDGANALPPPQKAGVCKITGCNRFSALWLAGPAAAPQEVQSKTPGRS